MHVMTRRQLLTTTALGAAALTIGTGTATAKITAGPASADCARNHYSLGHELSSLIADPAIAETVKNHAIKTAACSTCGTGIAPTGLGLAVSTWL